jgi:hypothetical protein
MMRFESGSSRHHKDSIRIMNETWVLHEAIAKLLAATLAFLLNCDIIKTAVKQDSTSQLEEDKKSFNLLERTGGRSKFCSNSNSTVAHEKVFLFH